MHNIMKRSLRSAALGSVAILAITASPALAADSDELAVSAEVTGACNVTTSPVDFGTVDVTSASNDDANGGISVTCTFGTPWTASADAGGGDGATVTARKMTSGSDTLNYALYTDVTRLVNFGGANTLGGTGTGVAQLRTVYGRVASGQTGVPAGNYADSVTISLDY